MIVLGDLIRCAAVVVFQPRCGLMSPWWTASAKVRRESAAWEEVSCMGMEGREPLGPGSARW